MELQAEFKQLALRALKEDRADADITSRLLFKGRHVITAHIVARGSGIICGIPAAIVIFKTLDRHCSIKTYVDDGSRIVPGKKILSIRGDLAKILAGERSALNILQRLSGVATLTRAYVDRVKGTRAKVYDTRKTTPGLRVLEKYAVRCGGGNNHRMDLMGAAMVKDNHLNALLGPGSRAKSAGGGAARKIQGLKPRLGRGTQLLIEAKSAAELELALSAKADVIMLDNMTVPKIKSAVKRIGTISAYRPQIEVTGGVTLENIRAIASSGVDRISVGRLTHSAPALDISLDVD